MTDSAPSPIQTFVPSVPPNESASEAQPDALTVPDLPRVARTGLLDEPALVAAAQAGDRAAMDRLLRAHWDRIWSVCRRITGSNADAEDAAQEASIAIVRHLHKFDGNAAFSTWVYRVATNAALDELRRRKRRPAVLDDEPFRGLVEHRSAERSTGAGFDGHVADRLAVDAALAKLPLDFRVPVILRDLCDLDYAEIATVLNIPPGTVRSRIARGRAALGHLMGTTIADGLDIKQDIKQDMTQDTPKPRNQEG
jgi:RNA polymerase sigma-70 factor, ECF subfamily